VEVVPVFEVVEIHGVEDAAVVSESDCAEDSAPGGVIVVVAIDSGIVRGDPGVIDVSVGLAPGFASNVVGLFSCNVVEEYLAIDAESVEGHLVEASARGGVFRVEFADGVERSFLPEAWEMLHTERTCGA